MIKIIPSISVINGKCVRLSQGNFQKMVEYSERPLEIATRFEDHGITKIHLIDLEGAKDGKGKGENWDALQNITGHTKLHVNFGGGINTDGDVQKVLEYGAQSFTVGSLAATKKKLFTSWIMSYGRDRVVLSADANDGIIQVRGWQKSTDLKLMEYLNYYYERSVQFVKCSDVSLDGMLNGPNFTLYKEIMEKFPEIQLMASGGVSSIDDIKRLNDLGLYGVIFGRAYYENKISLTEIEKFLSNLTTV